MTVSMLPTLRFERQAPPGMCAITAAMETLASAGVEARGAIFTRREVVDFILDLVGYTIDRPLHRLRLLEPSFGGGDFLLPAIDRLLSVWTRDRGIECLSHAIRAVEIHSISFTETRAAVLERLRAAGLHDAEAERVAQAWLIHSDFLLTPLDGPMDVVVGNPPYLRQEMIDPALIAEYRLRYSTIYDRADIYIPFIERSLTLLSQGGRLGFICADRWMKNRYGGPLRRMVADGFHLRAYVDMVDTPAFHSNVIAYPAVTIIGREAAGPTRIARRPEISASALSKLARDLNGEGAQEDVAQIARVTSSDQPWIFDGADHLALVRRLEAAHPTLEEAGCKVGIGVATGADKAFIGPYDALDVEPDRKLPIAMTRDIKDGAVAWRGFGVVNPFRDEGGLVDLAKYPRLRRHLESHYEAIAGRHVAQKAPANWYRTIDRITPDLARKPKLLIPDIKGEAHIVFENEGLYPHHNLYFITSETWDLHALQAVLLSGIARLFVATYSTKMHGGYLRFQAQYLRRIRLPQWKNVTPELRRRLIAAGERRDTLACNEAAVALYGLDEAEQAILAGGGRHGA